MRKYIFSFFLLITLFHFGCSKTPSGEIIYSVKENPERMQKFLDQVERPDYKELFKIMLTDVDKQLPHLKFHLTFNANEAVFHGLPNTSAIDDHINIKLAQNSTASKGMFYTNIKEDISLRQINSVYKDWLIFYKVSDLKWTIHDETKEIQGYTCQKATTTSDAVFLADQDITAWFTADISSPFGPLGLGGLPGIVLEVEQGVYNFYADDIIFSEEAKKIKHPTKGKKVTLQEYYNQVKELSDQLKGEYKMQ